MDYKKLREKSGVYRAQAKEQFKRLCESAIDLTLSLLREAYYRGIIAQYFRYWSYKSQIRHLLRYGALTVVSSATGFLVLEMIFELLGHDRLTHSLDRIVNSPRVLQFVERYHWLPSGAHLKIAAIVFLALSGLYLAWHNLEEARKPSYEYLFAQSIYSFLLDLRAAHQNKKPIPIAEALEGCHYVFKRSGIRYVALHLADSGMLGIRPEHVWPRSESASVVRLAPGEGVAGQVYEDQQLHVQYVPRLFFPINRRYGGWLFPHTVKFQFTQSPVPDTSNLKLWQIGNEEINPDAFKQMEKAIHYRSFLSVPVYSVTTQDLFGVLSLDFSRTDALDKGGIAMALGFALILGGEIATKGVAL